MKVSYLILMVTLAFVNSSVLISNDSNVVPLDVDEEVDFASSIEDKLLEKLEWLRSIMRTGSQQDGVPILDPAQLPDYDVEIDTKFFRLKGRLQQQKLYGLEQFSVEEVLIKILPLAFKFAFSVPDLRLQVGNYNINGNIMNLVPFYGNGKIQLDITKFSMKSDASFTIKGDHLKLDQLEIDIDYEKASFRIDGILDNPTLSKLLGHLLNWIINLEEFKEELSSRVTVFIKAYIDSKLETISLKNLIELLR